MADYLFDRDLLVGRIGGVRYERINKSEPYTTIPPAFIITDSDGAAWTLGTEYAFHHGEMYFNVLRNDRDVDEMACRVEYRGDGRVWIRTPLEWKHLSASRRAFI
jgi:hypothetical protein